MEDKLRQLMIRFCKQFKLKFFLRFSKSLTQKEINALNLLGSGELEEILSKYGKDYSKIDKEVNKRLRGMGGTGNIEVSTTKRLWKFLAGTDRNNKKTIYLRRNSELFKLLSGAYQKIMSEKLIDTIPIPPSKDFLSFLRRRGKFTMMVHECIHYILEKNGIDFAGRGVSLLDEGFCVFLHVRFDKSARWFYRVGGSGQSSKYRHWASFFENFFKNTPNDEIISCIQKSSKRGLSRRMKKFLKET